MGRLGRGREGSEEVAQTEPKKLRLSEEKITSPTSILEELIRVIHDGLHDFAPVERDRPLRVFDITRTGRRYRLDLNLSGWNWEKVPIRGTGSLRGLDWLNEDGNLNRQLC